MVLTRAFACAVPVVASDIPGYRAVMTDETGVLCPVGDADALAEAIANLLEDEPRRRELGEQRTAGRRRALLVGHDRRAARADLRGGGGVRCGPRVRAVAVGSRRRIGSLAFLCGVGALLYWHGPAWSDFKDAFTSVHWEWVAAAVGLNLLSIVARAIAWESVIKSAMPPPYPRSRLVFAAFCVGLLANAVLPGRVGELARVAVLTRRLDGRRQRALADARRARSSRIASSTSSRSRCSSSTCSITAEDSRTGRSRASPSCSSIGVGAVPVRVRERAAPRRRRGSRGSGRSKRVVTMARLGLGVMREPDCRRGRDLGPDRRLALPALRGLGGDAAFDVDHGVPAAALVLLLMNVATIVPLWPGNVGLVQVAVATPLKQYGVAYARGIAFGFGLQAIEASVGSASA